MCAHYDINNSHYLYQRMDLMISTTLTLDINNAYVDINNAHIVDINSALLMSTKILIAILELLISTIPIIDIKNTIFALLISTMHCCIPCYVAIVRMI